jgi:hypothetical protein
MSGAIADKNYIKTTIIQVIMHGFLLPTLSPYPEHKDPPNFKTLT